MKKFLIFLLLIFISLSGNSQIDTELSNQLQDILNNSVVNSGNNGVSAFVIMPDGQTWTGTAGIGCQNLSITDSTLFHGASTTKLNIAILMMLLVEDNLINLDETWNNYISLDVEFDTSITIRQLLNHTSGIADYLETPNSGMNIISDFNYFFTPEYILENLVSDTPDFSPGTSFHYSNSNYTLAALIIEEVTGNPVQTELRNRIWYPLGMNHTYFGGYETYSEPTAGVWWNFGNGLTNYSNMPTISMLSFAYGCGNIVTCPTDLGILLSGLLNNQLISSESLEEMMTFTPVSFSSWTAGYGLGIHHAYGQNEDLVIGHDGYYTNLTDMFHSMNYDFTLVTMTNTQTAWFGIFNPMYDVISDYIESTNIIDFKNTQDIMIYPNPTDCQFEIISGQIIHEFKITDIAGKIIYQDNPNAKIISANVYESGLYFLTIRFNNQQIIKKIVIKK